MRVLLNNLTNIFVVVIPGLRAGTCCAVLRGSLLIVCKSKCVCYSCNKELLYFTLLYIFQFIYTDKTRIG